MPRWAKGCALIWAFHPEIVDSRQLSATWMAQQIREKPTERDQSWRQKGSRTPAESSRDCKRYDQQHVKDLQQIKTKSQSLATGQDWNSSSRV